MTSAIDVVANYVFGAAFIVVLSFAIWVMKQFIVNQKIHSDAMIHVASLLAKATDTINEVRREMDVINGTIERQERALSLRPCMSKAGLEVGVK